MAPFAETPVLSMSPNQPFEVYKEPDLLDDWWTSDYLYALERRAIFSKAWICVTHRSRFITPGDYISLEIAGFPVLIILGKDRIARAFHNVCRHRAYTITKKSAGSSLVLGCRYHGWSYDTRGNLIKAPQFEGIEGFKKSENGLFKIRTCVDRCGFIHINLDASHLDYAPNCDGLLEFSNCYGMSSSNKWLTGWEVGGAFNWKTIGASDRTGIGTLHATVAKSSFMELLMSAFRRARPDLTGNDIFVTSDMTVIIGFLDAPVWGMLVGIPLSASQCTMKCDFFSTDEGYKLDDVVMSDLKALLQALICYLEQTYSNIKDTRPLEEPSFIHILKDHLRLERLAGMDVYPGRKEENRSASYCRAEKVCKELNAIAGAGKALHFASSARRVDTVQGELEW